jgi:hypothetical protein
VPFNDSGDFEDGVVLRAEATAYSPFIRHRTPGESTSAGARRFILRIPVKHLGEPMTTLRPSRADDGAALVDLWRRAVDATHDFLSAEDRQAIDAKWLASCRRRR